jgi:hypothetical protein
MGQQNPKQGEAAGRERGLEDKGGKTLDDIPKNGELRGSDDEGRDTTGTHGGPSKDGREGNER